MQGRTNSAAFGIGRGVCAAYGKQLGLIGRMTIEAAKERGQETTGVGPTMQDGGIMGW